jgi:Flp pilus assembly pilin Flp
LGRFLQEDPIWFNAGDMNVYRYVGSRPVKFRDPSGESAVEYACELVHSTAMAIDVGTLVGSGLNGLFTGVAISLAAINGDQAGADQALMDGAKAQAQLAAIAASSDMLQEVCGGKRKLKPPTCKSKKRPNSFAGDTLVMTRGGPTPISEINVGEEVAAYDQGNVNSGEAGSRQVAWRKVVAKSSRVASAVMKLTVRNQDNVQESISVTAGHPYLRPDNDNEPGKGILNLVKLEPFGEWTAVVKLKPGDELVSALGGKLVVDAVEVAEGPVRVYDLEIEGLHSFAVGGLAAWVHNSSGGGSSGSPGSSDSGWENALKAAKAKGCDPCVAIRALKGSGVLSKELATTLEKVFGCRNKQKRGGR